MIPNISKFLHMNSDSFESVDVKGVQECDESASSGLMFAGLSTEFCSGVLGFKSSVFMASSCSEQLQSQRHEMPALDRIGRSLYASNIAHKARLRATCGTAAGLVVQRVIAAATTCSKHSQHIMMVGVLKRVAAKRVTATVEGATLAEMLFFNSLSKLADFKRAFEVSAIGANLGCPHNKGILSCCYAYGRGVAEDRVKGFELARQSAADGSRIGQYSIGKCYLMGWGVARDGTEAVRLWLLAAAQGNAVAQNNLGCMFRDGHGVAQDDAEAVRLFRLAAAGHSNCDYPQASLGFMLESGRGVAQDGAEAVRLYRLSAARGNAQAQFHLANVTAKGLYGVAQDYVEAARLYRLSAEQDDVAAQMCLAGMLMQGIGVKQDAEEAVRLYSLAIPKISILHASR